MAYDEALADRIRSALGSRAEVTEKKMFGGLAFLRAGKMFCGIVKDRVRYFHRLASGGRGCAMSRTSASERTVSLSVERSSAVDNGRVLRAEQPGMSHGSDQGFAR